MQGWVSKTGGAPKAFLPVLLRRVRWVGLDSSRRAAMVPGPWTGDSSHTLARLPSMLGGRHSAGNRESVLTGTIKQAALLSTVATSTPSALSSLPDKADYSRDWVHGAVGSALLNKALHSFSLLSRCSLKSEPRERLLFSFHPKFYIK